jgi:hypothetical protein
MTITVLTLTVINGIFTLCTVGVLSVVIKIYSEVLKVEHIKRIGKDD